MAGFLDSKSRIMDTIVTNEGRRQVASGKMRIEFVSFSDGSTFYQADLVSGSADASNRLILEPVSLGRDQITVETDDSGLLIPYESNGITLVDGTLTETGSAAEVGAAFASLAGLLLEETTQNYRLLNPIGTKDIFDDSSDFVASITGSVFSVSDSTPTYSSKIKEISVTDADSFFQDQRLAHIPNFRHLPPVNKGTNDLLAAYACPGQASVQSFDQIKKALVGRERITVNFTDTSRESNLVTQIFEVRGDKMSKMDIIDFGEFSTTDTDGATVSKQVYFVGKVFVDDLGTYTFINVLTVVFE